MKIKTGAYRLINTDLVASESEAELEDKELDDDQLGRFRHEKLTRLYLKKGRKKKESLTKTNVMHQSMISSTHFDGSARGLSTFMIDLKSTSVSRSW